MTPARSEGRIRRSGRSRARAGLAALAVVAVLAACGRRDGGGEAGSASPGPDRDRPRAASLADRPPVEVRAGPGLAGVAARIAEDPAAWRPFPALGDPGRWLAGDTVLLYVVRDLRELEAEGLSRPERWVAGTADPEGARIALRAGSDLEPLPGLRSVFRHELAHLLLHRATGGRAPRWLHEGYAQLAAGAWSWDEAWRIQLALFRGGAGTLRDVDLRFRSNAEEVRVAYLLSYTVVRELWAAGGDGGLREFLLAIGAGAAVDEALRQVYGVTQDQFEKRWRASVMDRYGWLYLLSRAGVFWLLVTLVVVAVAFRRARYDRLRLARMRAEEARDDAREAFWQDGPDGSADAPWAEGDPGGRAAPGEDPGVPPPFVDDGTERG